MRYAVEGVDRRTRVKKSREVAAACEEDAVRLAGQGGLAVKRIYRVPDNAPPFGSVPPGARAPNSPAPAKDSAPPSAAFCYFLAVLGLIGGAILPFLGQAAWGIRIVVLGVLFMIAGALFHIIKLLRRRG